MDDNHHLQEQFKNLPKHSLNKEQKKRILFRLKEAQQKNKKKILIKPLLGIIFSIILFAILVVPQLSDIINNNQSDSFIELTAPAGKVFPLSDTQYEVIGLEGKVGLLGLTPFVAEDKRRVAKLLIYYWGKPSELVNKPYQVMAINHFGEEITLAEGSLSSSLYSEDANTLTNFSPFPSEGIWQLSFYVDEKLHGEFTLDVLPPFPKTEHYTLLDSPKELTVGEETEIGIESSWKDKEEIDVSLIDEKGKIVDQSTFVQTVMNYDANTNRPNYHFHGKLTFPEDGIWNLMIDGEETQSFKN
ncbi:hypothetical protein ACFSTA_09575 [Ornithinibacillus salinisoli]|uniref:DUF4871 domain-containing protein n=1 Tax=Ornithinibacillus salinisoli TaxID=1848459 RepID=A0ABW4W266_9BACI